jgi:hypothetical protein
LGLSRRWTSSNRHSLGFGNFGFIPRETQSNLFHQAFPGYRRFALGKRFLGRNGELSVCHRPYGIQTFLLFVLPALPGCLIPYGFPKISQTPWLSVGKDTPETHAFRVDITRGFADMGGGDHCTLSEVAVPPTGWVLPQTKISATYGVYVFGVALNYPVYISHSVALKLYRPGYRLIEINSWDPPRDVVWREAPDLASQEKELDHLFLMPEQEESGPESWTPIRPYLAAGSESVEHRRVLLFGASEYKRLAADAATGTQGDAVRCRLQSKAQKLQELADTVEPSPSFGRLWRGN